MITAESRGLHVDHLAGLALARSRVVGSVHMWIDRLVVMDDRWLVVSRGNRYGAAKITMRELERAQQHEGAGVTRLALRKIDLAIGQLRAGVFRIGKRVPA